MKKISSYLLVALAIMSYSSIFAGPQIINVSFYEAYRFNETVQYAENLGVIDGKIAAYLMDESEPLVEKAAVINTMQWDKESNTNTDTYKMFLGRKYGVGYENLEYIILNGDELFCLGYMMLLDEKIAIAEAINVLGMAAKSNSTSYVTNLFYTLAKSQVLLNDKQDCDAWTQCNAARVNTTLTKDINDQAINLIFEVVDLYQNSCD